MSQLIRNEWRFLIRTKLFLGISIGFVFALFLTVLMGNYNTNKQKEAFTEAKNHLREQWESIDAMNPHSAAHYGTYVFKPVNLLSNFDGGVEDVTGNVLRVEGHVQNEMVYSEASQMQSISRFGKLRSSLLLQYIIPIFLIFLAFNSMSGERRTGRLKMLVMQGASTEQIAFAKTISIWSYGLLLLSMVILSYFTLNFQSLTTDILQRVGLFFLSYAAFFFVLTGLTVFFSARWHSPTLALTTMLGTWMLWSIFLPYILMSSLENIIPLPSRDEFKTAIREDRSKGIDGHNPSDERGKDLETKVLAKYKVENTSELPINFDGIRMQADEEYGNKVWDKHFGALRDVMQRQKKIYQLSGAINPFASLQNASMGFAGTDNLHHQSYLLQVEEYRRTFIKALNDEHAYGGSKTGEWGWKADNDFFKSIKDFNYTPITIGAVLPYYLTDLLFLAFWSLLTAVLIFFATKNLELV